MMLRRLGPYSLLRQIASGGMAEVYLASAPAAPGPPGGREWSGEQRVAIKLIHPHNADDPELSDMLVQEARLQLQLQHPNIVATYDLGQEAGHYYIVMELVEGMDLFQALQRASHRDIAFPFDVAAYIAREVAAGLDYAHRKRDEKGQPLQLVHRDISPHNVLLSGTGEVKITDFGIAKVARRAVQTQAGVIKGKYAYMSPEQAWGDPVDARTDIFSTGILLYEMLAGQMMYPEESMDRLLDRVRRAEPVPPSTWRKGVPRDLEQIVMKALRKRPSDRWQTAADLQQALTDFLRGYAPGFRPQEQLGELLERLGDERSTSRQRRADEATAAMPRPRLPLAVASCPPVCDDNSLPFPQPNAQASSSAEQDDEPFGGETQVDGGADVLPEAQQSLQRLDEDPLGMEPTWLVDDLAPSRSSPDSAQSHLTPRLPPLPRSAGRPDTVLDLAALAPPALSPLPAAASVSPSRPSPAAARASTQRTPSTVPSGGDRRPRRGGLVLAFLLAMVLGAGGVLAVLLWPAVSRHGQLEVTSAPPGALVLIDGRPVETRTPVRILELDADVTHRLTVRMPGYRTWETEVRFEGKERIHAVQAVLVREP